MKGVWYGLLLPVLVLREDGFGRLPHAAVDVAEEARTSELWRNLCVPHDEVGAGQLFDDLAREARVHDAGGGGHD